MLTGWTKNSNNEYRYFETEDGIMAKGFQTLDGKKYYFSTGSGKMAVGWTTISGNKYYFDKETGVMATGDVTIDGTKYHFTSDGVLNKDNQELSCRCITAGWTGSVCMGWWLE